MKYETQPMIMKIGKNSKGERILRVTHQWYRGFSIKTKGNLPKTHKDGLTGLSIWEMEDYIEERGTAWQKFVVFGLWPKLTTKEGWKATR